MIHNYSIEAHNFRANRWEVVAYGRTFDEAFDKAEGYIGFHRDYDDVAILDMMGYVIWDSSHPLARMKDVGLERQEQEFVALDGSV